MRKRALVHQGFLRGVIAQRTCMETNSRQYDLRCGPNPNGDTKRAAAAGRRDLVPAPAQGRGRSCRADPRSVVPFGGAPVRHTVPMIYPRPGRCWVPVSTSRWTHDRIAPPTRHPGLPARASAGNGYALRRTDRLRAKIGRSSSMSSRRNLSTVLVGRVSRGAQASRRRVSSSENSSLSSTHERTPLFSGQTLWQRMQPRRQVCQAGSIQAGKAALRSL